MNVLTRITAWYSAQCDGDWEHSFGVNIDTLDNPGWLVKVDLTGTSLENRSFAEVAQGLAEDEHPNNPVWIHCAVRDNQFVGAGDPSKLEQILLTFVDWAEE